MDESWELIHLAAEVDVSGFLLAGIADFHGQPYLLLSEGLDWDRRQARRRLGQTFFLIAVDSDEVGSLVREHRAFERLPDRDRAWKHKQNRLAKAWIAFKDRHLQTAHAAWRVRASFPSPGPETMMVDRVRWKLLRKRAVPGEAVRARMKVIKELEQAAYNRRQGSDMTTCPALRSP
jgi:hypothetical protein